MPKLTLPGRLPAGLEDDEVEALVAPARQRASASPAARKKKTKHHLHDEILRYGGAENLSAQLGTERVFNPTFGSSRHEREWILEYLGRFYDDNLITDVLRKVKGGKEATVYCCAANPATGLALIAAKVYRPRMFRQLRNDSRYRQGRAVLDDRGKTVRDGKLLSAVVKKTRTGQELAHNSWLEHEYQTLQLLYQAGADVPYPVARGSSTILMEYIGEADAPAPALQSVQLEPDEVQPAFERLLFNIRLMLAHGRIHGDLSAFNVLYWAGELKLIDFPQVVTPFDNEEAYAILERDVSRVCQYFSRYGLRPDAAQITRAMWARHGVDRPLPKELFGDDAEVQP